MTKTKKLINDPDVIIEEMLDGMLAAHPGLLRQLEDSPRAIVALDGPRSGKVGVVIGGGSGHEPAFAGYVGRGLADAAAVGNVFASPSPKPILDCTKAVNGGAGVVYMYGNYAGDVMNFDLAAKMAKREGIEVRTIRVADDVASAPPEERAKRRGVAGDVFVFKVVGAAADRMMPLDEIERIGRKANERTLSMGVALAPCSLPETLRPNFEIGPEEMEIGMGVHGEPGVRRSALQSADEVVDDLIDRILAELGARRGNRVAVLVNGLGATSLMELYVMHRRVQQRLDGAGIAVHRALVGDYVSSLEMAGASITLMRLDAELTELLDHPCHCPHFRVV